ncbi:MAG: DUF4870 domain-containing protein [Phycisphaerales bacterium]|jgi:hypothetical protein
MEQNNNAGWAPGGDGMVAPDVQPWEKNYALAMHLTALAWHIVPVPVVPVLVMWLIKKDESKFVADHGREALNFQISVMIYGLIAALLTVILVGFVLAVAVYVLVWVGSILAAVEASKGRYYRYPACLRLVG